ncbi:hypothetical protein NK8_82790 (plasmid) [Caballeronia sp. NK8]|uniref:hypothetical protein n=1 Tax=Caballeronia sp. NK8 TaxID=140098 RepID=UPI001BB7EA6D|nr:hypothetical protein NK8_82790 [Caballeronia sp. NK8]
MRSLSTSVTFSATTSLARSPAPYATDSAVVLQVTGGLDEPPHFVGAEHDGQYAGHAHRLHPDHQLGRSSVTLKKNFRPVIAVVQRHGRCAVVDQIELVAAQVLDGGRVRRAPRKRANSRTMCR